MRIKDYLMRIVFYLVLGSGTFGFGMPEQSRKLQKGFYSKIYGNKSLGDFFNQN